MMATPRSLAAYHAFLRRKVRLSEEQGVPCQVGQVNPLLKPFQRDITAWAAAGAISLIEPQVLKYYSTNIVSSINEPLPTVTTKPRFGLVNPTAEPFILPRSAGHNVCRSVDKPIPTATTGGAGALVQPFIVPQFGERDGQAPRVHSVDEPAPAVTSHGAGALVRPFLIEQNHGGECSRARSVEQPLYTVTTHHTRTSI